MKEFFHDSIVVLGAQLKENGTPSETLRRRLELALKIWKERPVPVICCGARGKNEPEAEGDFMARYLRERGVAPEQAVSENGSYDTAQNVRNAHALLQERGLARPFVVTSDYHLPRALAICRKEGLTATGAGSASLRAYFLKNYGRELLAWGKFFLIYYFGWKG